MDKKNLIIMNPFSGKREANKYLTDIIGECIPGLAS